MLFSVGKEPCGPVYAVLCETVPPHAGTFIPGKAFANGVCKGIGFYGTNGKEFQSKKWQWIASHKGKIVLVLKIN